ncbi:MAG: TadE family protein [Acidimicrobiia bacterium]
MKQIRIRRKKRGRRGDPSTGAAAVEMAIVLPLLFLLVFGIIEFGFIFNRWTTVTHAAREGVRQLSLGRTFADAELAAEAAAPDLAGAVDCTASEPLSGEMEMRCDTTYDLALFIYDGPVSLHSTARMRRE